MFHCTRTKQGTVCGAVKGNAGHAIHTLLVRPFFRALLPHQPGVQCEPHHMEWWHFIKPKNVKVRSKEKKTKVFHKENACVHLLSTLKCNAGFIRFKHTKNLMNFRLKIYHNNESAIKIFLSLI